MIEPHDGIIGIGSGGTYALGTPFSLMYHWRRSLVLTSTLVCAAAARALIDQPHLDAEEIGRKAMEIAADICVYTNHNFVVEVLDEQPAATEKTD